MLENLDINPLKKCLNTRIVFFIYKKKVLNSIKDHVSLDLKLSLKIIEESKYNYEFEW